MLRMKATGGAESEGFEPSVRFHVRMFSKHVLSASQATLRLIRAANVEKDFYSSKMFALSRKTYLQG